jgi:hypothetical protein
MPWSSAHAAVYDVPRRATFGRWVVGSEPGLREAILFSWRSHARVEELCESVAVRYGVVSPIWRGYVGFGTGAGRKQSFFHAASRARVEIIRKVPSGAKTFRKAPDKSPAHPSRTREGLSESPPTSLLHCFGSIQCSIRSGMTRAFRNSHRARRKKRSRGP